MKLVEEEIIKIVTEKGAIKAVDLVIALSKESIEKVAHDGEQLISIIDGLVEKKEIMEIEYVVPQSNRIKSIYFPIGTDISVVKK